MMDLFNFIKDTEGIDCATDFLIRHRLLPNKEPKDCIKCGRKDSLKCSKYNRNQNVPFIFVCSQRSCRASIFLTRNSLFDQSKSTFPLTSALRMIYFWLLRISARETSNQFQMSHSKVADWFKVLQEVCAFVIINYTKAIGGPGHNVEVCEYQLLTEDESHDLWIFTGVDRTTGQNFAVTVRDLECETLWPIVKNYILPGSQVVSSECREFEQLESESKEVTLKFLLPEQAPRLDSHYHLDEMFSALKHFVENEIPAEDMSCAELYVYQFLYFNRDGVCNKPVSELVSVFFSDVRLVYPGFHKAKINEFITIQKKEIESTH